MRITQEMKLKMVEEHLLKGKSLSHISQAYDNYDVSNIKYNVNLYKKFGSEVFLNREGKIYYRDTKLLAIKRVLEGNESIRSVALDFGLTDSTILQDWIKNYKNKGEAGVQDTYPRKNYVLKDERARNIVDKKLKEENERLRAEIEYLKKSQSLTQKLEGATNKDKVLIVAGLRKKHKLEHLLAIIDMAPSVYYYNLSVIKNKVNKYQEIEDKIDELYLKKHKKRQHYNAIYIELKNLGYKIGNNKVLEIMRAKGYLKFRSKKWRKYSSYEGDKGFTLVELIVVIAIIAVLAVVSVVGYNTFIERANLSSDNQTLASMNNVLKTHTAVNFEDLDADDVKYIIELANGGAFEFTPKTKNYGFFYVQAEKKIVLMKYDEFQNYTSPSQLSTGLSTTKLINEGCTFEPELIFNLQAKSVDSVPDATISQESFKIVVETKMSDWFYSDQLIRHLNSFGDEKFKVLITLAPEKMEASKKLDFDNKLKEYNSTQDYPIMHVNTTFEKITEAIQDLINDRDYEMQEVLDDYLNYCYEDKLIADSWKRMKMQLSGATFDFNVKESLYYNGIDRPFSAHDYIGLYKEKSVRAIGKIVAIITTIKTDTGFKYEAELGKLTDFRKEQIEKAIVDGKNYGYALTNERYFFVEKFYETDFKKTSSGGSMGSRNFDLTQVLEIEKLPDTKQIAELLKHKTWN